MAANTQPIFSRLGSISTNNGTGMSALFGTSASGDYTGASANHVLVFTADPTNGSFVSRLRFKAGGTNVASVARIYINNGGAATTATNNAFYGEMTMPATTASNTNATIDLDYLMNLALPAGFRIYVGYGTAVAAGWVCTAVAGIY